MVSDEITKAAINHALRALRKRHLVEEGAHSPAFTALAKPFAAERSEWKEKAETLEQELQQCYKAQSRLSEQLVVEIAECRNSKALLEEKEALIVDLQKEITQSREAISLLRGSIEEKIKSLDLLVNENHELKLQLEEMITKARNAEAENKMLIERWMMQKMEEAERLNEANAIYTDLMNQAKASSMELLAWEKVDGVVRQFEAGAENYAQSTIPTSSKHIISAHQGGCGSILFEYDSGKLISGGQDCKIKVWDTNTGLLTRTLNGCLGSVLDLTLTRDNSSIIAASSSNNLYLWETRSGRIRHTLTGHKDKVCAVDANKVSNRNLVSAAYDRTIKVWDLQKGYCSYTMISHSNCNTLCFSNDEQTICSGHVDGNVRLWDSQSGKLINEVAAHSNAITSISLSQSGNIILTSGRDNVHNLFDMRSLEICGSLKADGNRLASNWSRSCLSSDENYVGAGSADGFVYIWSILKRDVVSTLKGHSAPVLSCSWSGLGKPVASADKGGTICIWT